MINSRPVGICIKKAYKKRKKAVGGRLGLLGSLASFPFSTFALLAFGSLDLGFFLYNNIKTK